MSNPLKLSRVLDEIRERRGAQDKKWGEQNHPDGTGPNGYALQDLLDFVSTGGDNSEVEEGAKNRTDKAAEEGTLTYEMILTEEWAEAVAAEDSESLRDELIDVAAVAVAWIEKIDRDLLRVELSTELNRAMSMGPVEMFPIGKYGH